MSVDKWIEQIDQMVERLSSLECDNCLTEWLDRMKSNGIVDSWKFSDGGVFLEYTIKGTEHRVEL